MIDEGEVRLEAHSEELDTDSVFDYAGAGSFLGITSVLAGTPHSLSAFAQTDVVVRRFSTEGLKRLFREDPVTGVDVLRSLARETATQLHRANRRLAEQLAEGWDEERIDRLLEAIAHAIAARADELGRLSVEQTQMGNAADKALKIEYGSLGVYRALAGKPGHGPLREDKERRITEMASPVGVIVALVPVTNPVPTFVNKALIALKTRNAIILSCHRRAQELGNETGAIIAGVLAEHGAPEGIVQWIRRRTSRRKTATLMSHEDVGLILATGGPAMVKAAYSSGKPAIGVGPGNAPAWIARDADLDAAARAVIDSKSFDYGILCGSEQHLVVDRAVHDEFVAALERHGAIVLDDAETARFMAGAFNERGDLLMDHVGQPAGKIAAGAGLERDGDFRLIVFRADASRPEGAQARERLAPVLSMFTVADDDAAIALCRALLAYEGAGHTANIHTDDPDRIERFARAMPTSRILVSVPSAMGASGVGRAVTGLELAFMLGCGTWGGNSTTDNITYENLLNVKRLARAL